MAAVNSSFNCSYITSNCSNITSNCSYITSNCSSITSNCSSITSDCSYITSNCSSITSNCSYITSNCSYITSNCSYITSNCSYITSDCSCITSNCSSITSISNDALFMKFVMTCIIMAVGLPLTLVAIYGLYSVIRNDHVAPIYIINLLISDLIQLCCMTVWTTQYKDLEISKPLIFFYDFGLVASVCFMVCIALERYLVVGCPLWYRFRRSIKVSVVVCVVVWILALVYPITFNLLVDYEISRMIFAVAFFIPLPLLIFSLGGTLRALSASISVPSNEKRQILGILVLVLLIYLLLFLPRVIWFLTYRHNDALSFVSSAFLHLSPLADLFLYIFMKTGIVDKLLASVCCCRVDGNDLSTTDVVNDISKVDSNDISSLKA